MSNGVNIVSVVSSISCKPKVLAQNKAQINQKPVTCIENPNLIQEPSCSLKTENIEWLTTKEAADYLRLSTKSLLNLTSNGKVQYYKFGRRNRFLLSDLKRLLLAEPRGGF